MKRRDYEETREKIGDAIQGAAETTKGFFEKVFHMGQDLVEGIKEGVKETKKEGTKEPEEKKKK